ncbi:MAG: hypothetical protein Q9211_004215 [Gyalolechia sp. 1 TL-2023]
MESMKGRVEAKGITIPAGLITVGSSSSFYASHVSLISTKLKLQRRAAIVTLVPSQVSNLKSALKLINSRATGSDLNKEDDDQQKLNQVLSSPKRTFRGLILDSAIDD